MNIHQPLFFKKNRVRRIYTGGKHFAEFFGEAPSEGYFPEEWVCSCVRALNEGSTDENEGFSFLETGEKFADVLEANKVDMLGPDRHELGVLVKVLDSSIRLPAQVHPDKAFSRRYFNSEFGKTESWIILDTDEDACIHFGFNDHYTVDDLKAAFAAGGEAPAEMMNRIPVKKGDVFLIPGKSVHAIGKGCLLLEVQEPTDFTIQPENTCGEYVLNDREKYIGLDPDVALSCFDMELVGKQAAMDVAWCTPVKDGDREVLIDYDRTPCFAVNRYTAENGKTISLPCPSIYVIVDGEGEVLCGEYRRAIKKGDYFFAPACINGKLTVASDTMLEVIECCLPQK